MVYHIHTLFCSVSKKINGVIVEPFLVCLFCHDISLCLPDCVERPVVYSRVDLHPARVNHWAEERVVWQAVMAQQYRDTHCLQCRDSNERDVQPVAYSLGHRDTYAQAGIRPWPHADRHGVDRDGMAVCKAQCLIDKRAKALVVVGPCAVYVAVYTLPVLADSDRANTCARFYI